MIFYNPVGENIFANNRQWLPFSIIINIILNGFYQMYNLFFSSVYFYINEMQRKLFFTISRMCKSLAKYIISPFFSFYMYPAVFDVTSWYIIFWCWFTESVLFF